MTEPLTDAELAEFKLADLAELAQWLRDAGMLGNASDLDNATDELRELREQNAALVAAAATFACTHCQWAGEYACCPRCGYQNNPSVARVRGAE